VHVVLATLRYRYSRQIILVQRMQVWFGFTTKVETERYWESNLVPVDAINWIQLRKTLLKLALVRVQIRTMGNWRYIDLVIITDRT
jgi:hypothetical protein